MELGVGSSGRLPSACASPRPAGQERAASSEALRRAAKVLGGRCAKSNCAECLCRPSLRPEREDSFKDTKDDGAAEQRNDGAIVEMESKPADVIKGGEVTTNAAKMKFGFPPTWCSNIDCIHNAHEDVVPEPTPNDSKEAKVERSLRPKTKLSSEQSKLMEELHGKVVNIFVM